jgi:hypothetical protein
VWGTGAPSNRDEVIRDERFETVSQLSTSGVRRTPHDGNRTGCWIVECELLKMQKSFLFVYYESIKSGQFPDESTKIHKPPTLFFFKKNKKNSLVLISVMGATSSIVTGTLNLRRKGLSYEILYVALSRLSHFRTAHLACPDLNVS